MSIQSPQMKWNLFMDPIHMIVLAFLLLAILFFVCVSAAGLLPPPKAKLGVQAQVEVLPVPGR